MFIVCGGIMVIIRINVKCNHKHPQNQNKTNLLLGLFTNNY